MDDNSKLLLEAIIAALAELNIALYSLLGTLVHKNIISTDEFKLVLRKTTEANLRSTTEDYTKFFCDMLAASKK